MPDVTIHEEKERDQHDHVPAAPQREQDLVREGRLVGANGPIQGERDQGHRDTDSEADNEHLHDGSVVSMDHLLGYGVLDGQLLQLVGVVLLVLRGIGQCGGIPLADLRFQPSDGLLVPLGRGQFRGGCRLGAGNLLHLLRNQLHVGVRVLEQGVVGPCVRHERGQLLRVARLVELLDHLAEPGDVDITERLHQLQVQVVLDDGVAQQVPGLRHGHRVQERRPKGKRLTAPGRRVLRHVVQQREPALGPRGQQPVVLQDLAAVCEHRQPWRSRVLATRHRAVPAINAAGPSLVQARGDVDAGRGPVQHLALVVFLQQVVVQLRLQNLELLVTLLQQPEIKLIALPQLERDQPVLDELGHELPLQRSVLLLTDLPGTVVRRGHPPLGLCLVQRHGRRPAPSGAAPLLLRGQLVLIPAKLLLANLVVNVLVPPLRDRRFGQVVSELHRCSTEALTLLLTE